MTGRTDRDGEKIPVKLKIKYFQGGEADEWTSAETHILHRWDWILSALAGVIVLSALMTVRTGALSLAEDSPAGFVLWFLVCCSYPAQGIIGIGGWLFGHPDWLYRSLESHPVLWLAALDLLSVVVIWGAGRLYGCRRTLIPHLRIAGNFLLILIGWGIFQMLLFGIVSIHRYGGQDNPAPAAGTEQVRKAED